MIARTEQMVDGGSKDAALVAGIYEPHLDRLDPLKEFFDVLSLDGGSNFQKAAKALIARRSRMQLLHAAEHVMALFFKDLSEIGIIKKFKAFYSLLYRWFGGAHHAILATFIKHCNAFNDGNIVGLMRPSETRMGGLFIAFLRLLRLREVFESMMASKEYANLKIDPRITRVLKDDLFWKVLMTVCKATFGPLKVLRLCDKKEAAMDKCLFFV